jgi:hypothetical protein
MLGVPLKLSRHTILLRPVLEGLVDAFLYVFWDTPLRDCLPHKTCLNAVDLGVKGKGRGGTTRVTLQQRATIIGCVARARALWRLLATRWTVTVCRWEASDTGAVLSDPLKPSRHTGLLGDVLERLVGALLDIFRDAPL